MNNISGDIRQSEIASAVTINQALVIYAQQMQNGCVQVGDHMYRTRVHPVAEGVLVLMADDPGPVSEDSPPGFPEMRWTEADQAFAPLLFAWKGADRSE